MTRVWAKFLIAELDSIVASSGLAGRLQDHLPPHVFGVFSGVFSRISCELTISEERTGNIEKRRLFVNPYRPEMQTEICCFSREMT